MSRQISRSPDLNTLFRRHPLAAAVSAALLGSFGTAFAQGLPSGSQVVSGSATVSTSGNQMQVTNTPNAIINWQSFSIGAQNAVRFQQQSATSQVLNRVVGNDLSNILGSLSSNGRVWLVNPNGVVFGQGARIDVGGLVASSLAISNDDFLSGKYAFSSLGGRAGVVNQGEISTPLGGRVWLIGETVSNEGAIRADGGSVVLAAGKSVELVDSAAPNVRVKITAPENQTLNLGSILAAGGSVDLLGGMVNQQGIVRADSLGTDASGRVTLSAQSAVTLDTGSETTARSTSGKGGSISVLGDVVSLAAGSKVDASGRAGGGQVLVGGDYQGKNPEVPNAKRTFVAQGAQVSADATEEGDGGRIIVWSDNNTQAYGAFSARGAGSGNGGFLETSGGKLDARPSSVALQGGPTGKGGEWLLDPNNITIDSSDGTANYSQTGGNFTSTNDDSLIYDALIENQLNNGVNVTVRTGTAGSNSQEGNIYVQADITATAAAPGSLTLEAHNDIHIIGRRIESTGGPMAINLRGDRDNDGSGRVYISGSTLSTSGGSVTMRGASGSGNAITILNSYIFAGNGDVSLTGFDSPVDPQVPNGAFRPGFFIDDTFVSARSIFLRGDSWNPDQVGLYANDTVSIDLNKRLYANGLNAGAARLIMNASDAELVNSSLRADNVSILTPGVFRLVDSSLEGNVNINAGDIALVRSEVLSNFQGGCDGSCYPGSPVAITLVATGDSGSGSVQLTDSLIDPEGGSVSISGSGVVSLAGSTILGGLVDVSAGDLRATGASLIASDSGDIITIRADRLNNSTGPSLLSSQGGWRVYLPFTQSTIGGLPFDYEQFNSPAYTAPNSQAVGLRGMFYATPLAGDITLPGKEYDGNNILNFRTLTNYTFSSAGETGGYDAIASDSNNAVGLFDNKNVGIAKPVSYSGNKFSVVGPRGTPVYGADLSYFADISPRLVAAPNAQRFDKVYDGTAVASAQVTLTGFVAGDDVTGLASGTYGSRSGERPKDVAVDKPVTYSMTLSGADSANYVVPGTPQAGVGTISPRDLAATAFNTSKTYDGNASAVINNFVLNGSVIAGDDVVASLTGTYGSAGSERPKDVANNKPITVSGSLSGLDARNYRINLAGPIQGDILPRALAVSAASTDKIYDGNAIAVVSTTAVNAVAGDSLIVTGSGTFGSAGFERPKDAALNKPVEVTFAATGPDSGNYTLAPVQGQLFASILPRTTNVSLSASDKVYDGNAVATVVVNPLSNIVLGDNVSATATGMFGSAGSERPKDVADSKPVAVTFVPTGTDARNYIFATTNPFTQAVFSQRFDPVALSQGNFVLVGNAPVASASITPQLLSNLLVTGSVQKVYDTTSSATLSSTQYSLAGVRTDDVVTVTGPTTGTFDNSNVGTGKRVTASGTFQLAGADAGNYVIPGTIAVGNVGTITPATLTFVADPALRFAGATPTGLTGSVTGFLGSDTAPGQTSGNASWDTTATAASPVGIYSVTGSGLTSPNYLFVQALANATALTLSASNQAGSVTNIAAERSVSEAISAAQGALASLTSRSGGSVLDLTGGQGRTLFGPQTISGRTDADLTRLLDARRKFKRKLFADGVYKLELDPALSDVPTCTTLADGANGLCRLSPEQIAELQKTRTAAATPIAQGRKVALPQIQKKVAVFFGVGQYQDKKIPELNTSLPDVDSVSKVFAERMGYDVRVVRNPTKADIISTLNRLAGELGPEDSLLVYYSGHGYTLERNGAGYWLAADAPVDDPKRWISNDDVARLLAAIPSKQVALITDSCYSSAFTREGTVGLGTNASADDVLTKRSVVVLASGGDEPVDDVSKNGHSVFAWNLMNTLRAVEDWKPGNNVFSEVRTNVRKELPQTPRYGTMGAAGHQAGGDYLFEQR